MIAKASFLHVLLVLGLCALVSVTTDEHLASTEVPPSIGGQLQNSDDILSLINLLGSDHFSVREDAFRKLEEKGLTALPFLKQARESKDPEIQRRCELLISRIRARHHIPEPTYVNGVEFQPEVHPPTWSVGTPIRLSLKITNWNDTPFRFWLHRANGVVLESATGKKLNCNGGGGSGLRAGMVRRTPLLAKGESYTITEFDAQLTTGKRRKEIWEQARYFGGQEIADEKPCFCVRDGANDFSYYHSLDPGKYWVSFWYSPDVERVPIDGEQYWLDKARTIPVLINLNHGD